MSGGTTHGLPIRSPCLPVWVEGLSGAPRFDLAHHIPTPPGVRFQPDRAPNPLVAEGFSPPPYADYGSRLSASPYTPTRSM